MAPSRKSRWTKNPAWGRQWEWDWGELMICDVVTCQYWGARQRKRWFATSRFQGWVAALVAIGWWFGWGEGFLSESAFFLLWTVTWCIAIYSFMWDKGRNEWSCPRGIGTRGQCHGHLTNPNTEDGRLIVAAKYSESEWESMKRRWPEVKARNMGDY